MAILPVSQIKKTIGKIVLKPISILNSLFNNNILLDAKENTTYTVRQSRNLGGNTYTLPKNTVLVFEDGAIISNGTLVGNDNTIIANLKVFDNVVLKGTWKCIGNVGWWANGTDIVNNTTGRINDYQGLLNALDSSFTELVFPPLKFYTNETLVLSTPKKLVLQGNRMRWPLYNENTSNTTILFTDQNKDLLQIDIDNKANYKSDTVEITGGNFDISLAGFEYSKSVINVLPSILANRRIWGLKINTNIIGCHDSNDNIDIVNEGIGINLNHEEGNIGGNSIYLTNVRIDSDISYIGTGICAKHWGDTKNWLTDLNISGNIRYCHTAIDITNIDRGVIDASLLSGKFWDNKQNNAALIHVKGGNGKIAIGSNIYDIYANEGNAWSNRYALIVDGQNGQDVNEATANSVVIPFGVFEVFLIESRSNNVSMVQGRIYSPIFKDTFYYGGDNNEKSARVILYGDELFNKL